MGDITHHTHHILHCKLYSLNIHILPCSASNPLWIGFFSTVFPTIPFSPWVGSTQLKHKEQTQQTIFTDRSREHWPWEAEGHQVSLPCSWLRCPLPLPCHLSAALPLMKRRWLGPVRIHPYRCPCRG